MPLLPRRTFLAATLSSLFSLSACGGGEPEAAEDTALRHAADNAVHQGLVGVVLNHLTPETRWQAQAGVRQAGTTTPLGSDDAFMIGSTTKAVTSALAGRLVARGLIAWRTTLAEALPDLAADMRPAYRSVTLEQLLGHRGGLPAFNNPDDLLGFNAYLSAFDGPLPDTLAGRERFFARWLLAQDPPASLTPGQTFAYSNAGYALAALMLETRSGRGYADLVTQELAQPLGLSLSWTAPDQRVAAGATGHIGAAGQLAVIPLNTPEVARWLEILRPAGFGLTFTPASYARWVQWHLKALRGAPTPLADDYVRRLKALGAGGYDLGWIGAAIDGRPVLAHDGEYDGFSSLLVLDQGGRSASFGFTNTQADDGVWTINLLQQALLEIERALPPQ